MKHIPFGSDPTEAKVAIAIKTSALNRNNIERHYLSGVSSMNYSDFIAYDLEYDTPKKCSAATAKKYAEELLEEINQLGIKILMICDGTYFKILTKKKKVDPNYGYVCDCLIPGYEQIKIVLCPNYQAVIYNPTLKEKINRSLNAIESHMNGVYEDPGKNIIHSAYYPDTFDDIENALRELHQYPELTCDIEATSLEFWNAGISTIAFAWDKHNGICFGVDRGEGTIMYDSGGTPDPDQHPDFYWRTQSSTDMIKDLLMEFFLTYEGKIIYHGIGYDGKVLVYELFMKSLDDYRGMIHGIKTMTKNFEDTLLITYLATNNAVQNVLDLKSRSAEFTGDYAEDVIDTTKIPLPDLRIYNLKDCLATWYVKEKYEPIMIADKQQFFYQSEFKEYAITLMQTELCGMPIDPEKVQHAKKILTDIVDRCLNWFRNSEAIKTFHAGELILKAEKKTKEAAAKAKTSRKTKVYTPEDKVIAYDFNPNSDTQIRRLLYDYMGLPVLDYTKGKQASCSSKTLQRLKSHTDDKTVHELIDHLKELADANIILTTFIPAFENAQQLPDGSWRLYGNFKLGGTQSLRLSSNNPNLQNIPAGSTFAKLVKACFISPPDWIFMGSDMDALEDKTGALLTQDPQRIKIYTDGFCGHCLRTQYYWSHLMPEIDPNSVQSINSIKTKYSELRQASKAPSFALQYLGTWRTLMKNCGFSEKEAKAIDHNYHRLYAVSDKWMEDLIEGAKKDGYITMAFGTRIRTPLLAKTVGEGKRIPFAAEAEARSAGNAATQSYCVLTLRAMNEFRKRVWASPYIYDILPSATIHDSIYQVTRDDVKIVKWVNDNLIECMAWNDLPELQHDTIKMSSGLEIYWPSWANSIDIPNGATVEEIKSICNAA